MLASVKPPLKNFSLYIGRISTKGHRLHAVCSREKDSITQCKDLNLSTSGEPVFIVCVRRHASLQLARTPSSNPQWMLLRSPVGRNLSRQEDTGKASGPTQQVPINGKIHTDADADSAKWFDSSATHCCQHSSAADKL